MGSVACGARGLPVREGAPVCGALRNAGVSDGPIKAKAISPIPAHRIWLPDMGAI